MRFAYAKSIGLRRLAYGGGSSASEQLLTLASAINANASVWNFDDAATLTTRDDGSDTFVTGITDGLENRAELVQATAANQPDLIEVGGRMVGARVGGDSRKMQGTYGAAVAHPYTRILVLRAGDTAAQRFCDKVTSAAGVVGIGSSTDWFFFNSASVVGGTADTNWHFIQAVFNGASSELYVDGSLVASGNAGTRDVDGLTLFNLNGSDIPMSSGGRIGIAMEFPVVVSNGDAGDLRSKVSEFYPIGQSL